MTPTRYFVAIAWALLASTPGVVQEQDAEAPDELPTRKIKGSAACLRLDRIQDFQVIDSQTLIVWRANHKDPHKIGLFHGCPRLRSADAIFFDARGWDQVCGRGGEYLVVTRPGIQARPFPGTRTRRFPEIDDDLIEERCAVKSVERINDDVVHELLVSGGHAAPRGPERPDSVQVIEIPTAEEADSDARQKTEP